MASCVVAWPSLDDNSNNDAVPSKWLVLVDSLPSSRNVVVVTDQKRDNATTPPRGTAWNVTSLASSTFAISQLSAGGAYFGRVNGSTLLLIQQSGAFDDTFVYCFCTASTATRHWSLDTRLLAHDDANRSGSIVGEFRRDDTLFDPIPDAVLRTGDAPSDQSLTLAVQRTLELAAPSLDLVVRFAITSNGSGSRDVFGLYPITMQPLFSTPTTTPTTTTTTTTTTSTSMAATTTTTTAPTTTTTTNFLSTTTSTSTSTLFSSFSASTTDEVVVVVGAPARSGVRAGDLDMRLVGGIVGGVLVLICIALIAAVCWHRKRAATQRQQAASAPLNRGDTVRSSPPSVEYGHLIPLSEADSEPIYDQVVPLRDSQTQQQSEYDATTSPLN
jgi:hypothetical protein